MAPVNRSLTFTHHDPSELGAIHTGKENMNPATSPAAVSTERGHVRKQTASSPGLRLWSQHRL